MVKNNLLDENDKLEMDILVQEHQLSQFIKNSNMNLMYEGELNTIKDMMYNLTMER